MQNSVLYRAFLTISWLKPRSIVTNYSERMIYSAYTVTVTSRSLKNRGLSACAVAAIFWILSCFNSRHKQISPHTPCKSSCNWKPTSLSYLHLSLYGGKTFTVIGLNEWENKRSKFNENGKSNHSAPKVCSRGFPTRGDGLRPPKYPPRPRKTLWVHILCWDKKVGNATAVTCQYSTLDEKRARLQMISWPAVLNLFTKLQRSHLARMAFLRHERIWKPTVKQLRGTLQLQGIMR